MYAKYENDRITLRDAKLRMLIDVIEKKMSSIVNTTGELIVYILSMYGPHRKSSLAYSYVLWSTL